MISGELYAIAAAICWSMAAVFYKKGIGSGAIPAVLVRTFFAMFFLLILYLILRGAVYMKGLENISVSKLIPILFTFPLLTILLSALFLNENIRLEVVGGTFLILIWIWNLAGEKAR